MSGSVLPMRRPARGLAAAVVVCAWIAAGCVSASPADPPPPARDAQYSGPDAELAHGPHESLSDFAHSHFSAQAWRDGVGRGYFGSTAVLLPIGLALGATGIAPSDDKILRRGRHTSQTLGNVTLGTLIAGTVAVGLFAPGEGRSAAEERWTIAEALAVNLASTVTLNAVVGRRRPDASSRTSFPSGHTSNAFAAATLIDRNSGHAWGIPAYVLATATAFSRVESRRHFPSDVLAGAALGVLSASVIDALHFGGDDDAHGISRRRNRPQLALEMDSDGRPMLALTLQF